MHPILVHIPTPWGEIPIYSYGVMLGLSLIIAWYFIMYMGAKKENLDRELMANTFLVTAIAGIAGGRLLYILTNLDDFDTIGKWFDFRSGGLVAYGGFLGGAVGSWVYLRMKRVPLRVWADLVAPTLATGLLFTRVGCYLYGCDFGARLGANAPRWLKALGTFPHWEPESGRKLLFAQEVHGAPAWIHHVRAYGLSEDAQASFPVHPTQLYESLFGLALFGASLLVWKHRKFRGQVVVVVVMLYAVWRFFVEMLRDDPGRGAALGLSTSQIISLTLLPLMALAWYFLQKQTKEGLEPVIPTSALEKLPELDDDAKPSSSTVKRKKPKKKR